MPVLEITPAEMQHHIAMLARTHEIRRKLRTPAPQTVAPVVIKPPVVEPDPTPPPRHPSDAIRYPFPLIYPEFVPEELRATCNPNEPRTTTKEIILQVAEIAGVSYYEIIGSSHATRCVRPRQFAMWRVHTEQKLSMSDIGRRFGGRDHTTAMHAIRVIKKLIDSGVIDPQNPAWVIFRACRDRYSINRKG
jgi:hypothetical protein